MTENSENPDRSTGERPRWIDEIDEAFERTGDALRGAWDATSEKRASTLVAARQAVQELGEMIEEGIAAAKERWAAESASDEGASPSEEE